MRQKLIFFLMACCIINAHEQDDTAKLRQLYKSKSAYQQISSSEPVREVFNQMDHVAGPHEGSFSYRIVEPDSVTGH